MPESGCRPPSFLLLGFEEAAHLLPAICDVSWSRPMAVSREHCIAGAPALACRLANSSLKR